jgi:hypothetical protein
MAWLGLKRLAFVPLTRSNIATDVPPPDWSDQITQRVFLDKFENDPTTAAVQYTDRSVRSYIHTVSSGLADLDVVVQPPQAVVGTGADGKNVEPDVLDATMGDQLRADGFDGAAIVMLGGPDGGETTGYWSRFCMSDDVGHWVGELVHQADLSNLPDLWDFDMEYPGESMGTFEQESELYGATHFSAWTKRLIKWLDPSTVSLHPGGAANYTLHAVGLIQPPPDGRVAAVQIGQQVPYLMVEARLRVDQFDVNISSEGVIVYQVQTSDPTGQPQFVPQLNLLTKTALAVGQSFTTDNGVTVQVNSSVPGGFSITVNVQVWQHLSPITGHTLQADLDCSGLPNAGRSVCVGDVDGDGRNEVIVEIDAANSGGNDFWVMQFDPAADSWQHLSPIPGHTLQADLDCSGLPNAGRSVCVGDVDGDGRDEVIVQIDAANSGGNDFWVMQFDPAEFSPAHWQHLSPIPGHTLQADLDCSGLPNAGRSVSVGDVDGDGRDEVIVQIDAANSGGNDFWVMKFNPAAGSWQHLSPIPGHTLQADLDCSGLPNAGRSVSVGDVDGDGRAEVIVQIDAANSGGNDFWVMQFDPAAGSWQHLSPIPGHTLQADLDCSDLPNAGRSVRVGDVDGDGRDEVIVQIDASGSGGNDFWVMKFDPSAGNWGHLSPIKGHALQADIDCSGLSNAGRSVSVGDVDNDGRAEVIVQIDASGSGGNDFWVMKFEPGAASWAHLAPTGDPLQADFDCSSLPNAGRSVSVGDVDNDGRAEVIVQIDASGSGGNDFWVMKWLAH